MIDPLLAALSGYLSQVGIRTIDPAVDGYLLAIANILEGKTVREEHIGQVVVKKPTKKFVPLDDNEVYLIINTFLECQSLTSA